MVEPGAVLICRPLRSLLLKGGSLSQNGKSRRLRAGRNFRRIGAKYEPFRRPDRQIQNRRSGECVAIGAMKPKTLCLRLGSKKNGSMF
jgi:hypothetical protein